MFSSCLFSACAAVPAILDRLRRCASGGQELSRPSGRRVGPGRAGDSPSLRRDSSVLSGEKPLRRGRLSITTALRHGRSHIWGDLLRTSLWRSILSPRKTGTGRRGTEERMRRERTGPGRRLGSGRAGRTCSQRVKPSLKHKTPSPHALVSFVRSPPRCLQ